MHPSYKIRGDSAKTKGNAAVGITMIDRTRHTSVRYCEPSNVGRHIQNPLFKSLEELTSDIYEVKKIRKKLFMIHLCKLVLLFTHTRNSISYHFGISSIHI